MGVPVPEAEARALYERLASLRARHAAARWTPSSKLHLTLVFLGATTPSDVDLIGAAVAQVAAGWAPFEVGTGEGGGYLGRRGGVAWLEVEDGRVEAARLSLAVDSALESRAYEARPPRPHLTLARSVTENLLDEARATAAGLYTTWTVDRVVLYRSFTGPGSADYEPLLSHPLAGRAGA